MPLSDSVVAVFDDHKSAATAVKALNDAGFDVKRLSVVGKGYHSEERVTGFYNAGNRVRFWGERGAFWGGLWGLFFGGLFLTIPVVGHVIVLGYLATMAVTTVESAVLVGTLSAISAAFYSIGIPRDSVLSYEAALKADGFMVMAHGTEEETRRAKSILAGTNPRQLDVHIRTSLAKQVPLVPAVS